MILYKGSSGKGEFLDSPLFTSPSNYDHQTSLTNYINNNIVLNKRETEVYNILKDQPATSFNIMKRLGWKNPNKVRPRLTDLKNKGLITKIAQTTRSYIDSDDNIITVTEWIWSLK